MRPPGERYVPAGKGAGRGWGLGCALRPPFFVVMNVEGNFENGDEWFFFLTNNIPFAIPFLPEGKFLSFP